MRGGALLKPSTGGLGFKEPALLICVTLPAYLFGRGRRGLKTSGGGTVRPLNTSKETGQDPRGGDGRAFVLLAKGIPTGIKYTYSNSQYAPEGMGPRSGVHDGKGARRGTLVKGRTKLRFSTE